MSHTAGERSGFIYCEPAVNKTSSTGSPRWHESQEDRDWPREETFWACTMAPRRRGLAYHRRFLANIDFYCKVPHDLLEGSKKGSAVSWVVLAALAILFFRETQDFLTPKLVSDLHLDAPIQPQQEERGLGTRRRLSEVADIDSMEDRIEVSFNITMMDLKCKVSFCCKQARPTQICLSHNQLLLPHL